MPDKLRKLLTKLRADCGLPTPPRGEWLPDAQQRDFLSKFAGSVETAAEVVLQDVHSVPSVYARPILFSQALKDENHPSRPDVVSQWRGLLAIFALQPWEAYNIDYEPYRIAPPPAGAHSFVGNIPDNGLHLDTMLHSMAPKPSGLWNPLHLILCDEVVVGAVSPWTMAFTCATPAAPRSVKWVKEEDGKRKLCDPIAIFGQPGQRSVELTLLDQWIGHVEAVALPALQALGIVQGDFLNVIASRLEEWRTDLTDYLVNPANVAKVGGAYAQRRDAMPWVISGLDAADAGAGPLGTFLRRSLPPTQALPASPLGDVWLAPTRPDATSVVVLKKDGMDALTRLDGHVFASDIDLATLTEAKGDTLETRGHKPHKIPWVLAEDFFFPAKLTYVKLNAGQSLVASGAPTDYSLPLTPEFFRFFSYADVRQKLKVEVIDGGKTLQAKLTLPVKGGGSVSVKKDYPLASEGLAKTGDKIPGLTPGFVLWPNFYSETWPHNLASFGGPNRSPLSFQAAPLYADASTDTYSQLGEPPENMIRIWQCARAPIGFALMDEGKPAGLVLRGSVNAPPAILPGMEWRVALDFGTANTMISYQVPGDQVKPLPIEPRIVTLNDSPLTDNLQNAVAPPKGLSPPFKTLCYRIDATMIRQPLAVYAHRSEFLIEEMDKLIPNLKWGRGGPALNQYLKALVRLSVCEARAAGVETVRFKWSFPLSLSTPPKEEMKGFWAALPGMFSGGGMKVILADDSEAGKGDQADVSESEAASRALAWYKNSPLPATASGLCVVLDIGGGSTDFAFWSEGKLKDYISCKLAANDVLRGDWLQVYPGFLADIYWLSTGGTLPSTIPSTDAWNKVEMWINNVLSFAKYDGGAPFDERENGWLNHPAVRRMVEHKLLQTPWLCSIRTSAYMLLVGVCYFAGLRARAYRNALRMNSVTVALTGRGSSLCAWVSNRAANLQRLLADSFSKGYQRDETHPPATINVLGKAMDGADLPALKTEVSQGALLRKFGEVPQQDVGKAILGEINWRRPGSQDLVDWNTTLERSEMTQLLSPDDATGVDCYIQQLVSHLKKEHKLFLVDDRIDNLVVDWAQVAHLVKTDLIENEVTQPVFALELKSLLNQYFGKCAAARTDAANAPTGPRSQQQSTA